MTLLHPWMLLLLLLWIPVVWLWLRRRRKGTPSLTVSSLAAYMKLPFSWREGADYVSLLLRLAAIGALAVALARPQKYDVLTDSSINGTNIVLALDISESMMTPDMRPNRFEAARKIASDFVEKRTHDNVGLVAFAGESLTMMPMTTDMTAVINAISLLNPGSLGDGTAIGDGLASAINRVLSGDAVSKSIILLTDGTNNAGEIDPIAAAQIARDKGIKVYTIAIGSDQVYQVGSYFDPGATIRVPIDEDTLKKIAAATGGKFYRATENSTLQNVFDEIDSLERSTIHTSNSRRTEEGFGLWMLIAVGCFAAEELLRYTLLRRLP